MLSGFTLTTRDPCTLRPFELKNREAVFVNVCSEPGKAGGLARALG